MKALVYTNPNTIELQEYPDPVINAGEVVIRVEAVGICGSDMHAYRGHDARRRPGLVMGHELSGVIVESAGSLYKPGRKVTVNPLITCGHCFYCRTGRDNLCENRTMIGMNRPGAYAEYVSIPASSVIPLPDDISHTVAVLAEPGASALHALDFSIAKMQRPVQEQHVLVIGGGAIGLMMILLLQSRGVRHIDLAETSSVRRHSAAKYCTAKIFDPVADAPDESTYHYVVDAVGCKATRDMAIRAVRPGGVFMHIGLQDWASEVDMRKVTLAELTVLGTYCYSYVDMQSMVEMLHDNVLGDLGWVEIRPLQEGSEAFRALAKGEVQAAKIVLVP